MAELGEIGELDKKILNQAVNEGVADIKKNTPVDTGSMRKAWRSAPAVKGGDGVKKTIVNVMDYSSYVNDGHRLVNKLRETTGFVPGQHMLEKGVNYVNKRLIALFKTEIERIGKKYDK
ncbi:MAG: HK97 gp10 family phage protein [Clostridiales bacterium]|nr:HK97 gp10 family phage protein [Clostridiales bacterium]